MSAKRIYVLEGGQEIERGKTVLYGIAPHFKDAPIVNLPADTIQFRRRIRAHEMAQVFVKTADGAVTRYYAGPDGPGALKLLWTMGANKREVVA